MRPDYPQGRPNGAGAVASVIVVGFIFGSVVFVGYVIVTAIVRAVIGS